MTQSLFAGSELALDKGLAAADARGERVGDLLPLIADISKSADAAPAETARTAGDNAGTPAAAEPQALNPAAGPARAFVDRGRGSHADGGRPGVALQAAKLADQAGATTQTRASGHAGGDIAVHRGGLAVTAGAPGSRPARDGADVHHGGTADDAGLRPPGEAARTAGPAGGQTLTLAGGVVGHAGHGAETLKVAAEQPETTGTGAGTGSDPTLYVGTEQELNQAIATVDAATSGTYVISFTSNITEGADGGQTVTYNGATLNAPLDLYALNVASGVSVTIDGDGDRLDGADAYRGLMIYAGDVTIQDLTIADAKAIGGAGGQGHEGGGGGAGLGGGLFVASGGAATLDDVTFEGDAAKGGVGGVGGGAGGGGGGGGLGGAGGAGGGGGGGGGVGVGAAGGGGYYKAGQLVLGPAGAGVILGGAGGGEAGSSGAGGGYGGGGGGAPSTGGGGGVNGGVGYGRFYGGGGGFGGGGGGGDFGGGGGFGGGGAGGFYGGGGGFGGGGGGFSGGGGGGGFGAGGGGSSVSGGSGGGGGLGAGGDIFVQAGGGLTIEGGSLGAGAVSGGSGGSSGGGGSPGGAGAAYGDGVFIQGSNTLTLSPAGGQTLTILGVIADESGAGWTNGFGGTGGVGGDIGAVVIDGAGKVELDAANTFTGGVKIESGTLVLGAYGAAGTGAITFAGAANLDFSIADAPTNTLAGFTASDAIDITDLAQTGTTTADGTGTVTLDDGLTLHFGVADANQLFQLVADGGGGAILTEDNAPCYLRGTRILTDRGEVAVEDLSIGDRLVTLDGEAKAIRWIGRRRFDGWLAAGNPDIQPIRFRAGAIGDHVPARDLLVSPEHAMFLDGALIPARHLVNGVSILPAAEMDEVEYFHLELESHDVIFAEGAASESFLDDGNRGMFHNVYDYHRLYPDAPRHVEPEYCAPRVEDGYELEAVRRRLNGRAARLGPDGTAAPAPVLRGRLDLVTRHVIEGWAFEPADPDARLTLAILANGAQIGRVVAGRHRPDLEAAGIGDGAHAFRFELPRGFTPDRAHEIEVRRAADWTPLPGSPVRLAAARPTPAAAA